MEIRFYKPTVADISKMQEIVKEEVVNGKILLRTEDEIKKEMKLDQKQPLKKRDFGSAVS